MTSVVVCLAEVVRASAREVLASYSFPTSARGAVDPAVADRTYASSIGYSGLSVRGAIVLVAPAFTWGFLLHEAFDLDAGVRPAEAALADVAAEVANLVAGQAKRHLSARGFDIAVALPTATSGVDLRDGPPSTQWIELAVGPTVLRVGSVAAADPSLVVEDAPRPPTRFETSGLLLL
ncbi:MAG: chemotaxis protein CheX [Myxococcales bacterium]|jgi:hypothetical protein|nr:chemotaxis protein CheX [Myxococcales bacterium]